MIPKGTPTPIPVLSELGRPGDTSEGLVLDPELVAVVVLARGDGDAGDADERIVVANLELEVDDVELADKVSRLMVLAATVGKLRGSSALQVLQIFGPKLTSRHRARYFSQV